MRMEDRPQLSKIQAYGTTKALIAKVNTALQRLVPTTTHLTELNQVTFAAALYVERKVFPRPNHQHRARPRASTTTPAWKKKLQKQLNSSRKELTQIKQFLKDPTVQGRLKNTINRLRAKHHTNSKEGL